MSKGNRTLDPFSTDKHDNQFLMHTKWVPYIRFIPPITDSTKLIKSATLRKLQKTVRAGFPKPSKFKFQKKTVLPDVWIYPCMYHILGGSAPGRLRGLNHWVK